MNMDPFMPAVVGIAFAVLLLGLLLRRVHQPQIVAYLLAGVLLGPHGLGIIVDAHAVEAFGHAGVILLLFFLGMEISLPRLLTGWRISVVGTLVQIGVSVALVAGIGAWLDWPLARSVLLGFVVSLSSTAVVVPLLRERKEIDTAVGRDVVGVLLVQDVAVVGMVIVVGRLTGTGEPGPGIVPQALGAAGILALVLYVGSGRRLPIPPGRLLADDHELQVFAAFGLCFGMALLTAVLGLSTATGAFVAGILVAAAPETEWARTQLEPLHVLLVAFFFVSVGVLLDLDFLRTNLGPILLLVAAVLVTNTLVNAGVFRLLGRSWGDALYGGALLSEIGEFSFVLASVGLAAGVIGPYAHQATVAVIALTLLVSPALIAGVRRAVGGLHPGYREVEPTGSAVSSTGAPEPAGEPGG